MDDVQPPLEQQCKDNSYIVRPLLQACVTDMLMFHHSHSFSTGINCSSTLLCATHVLMILLWFI
jgi:hypothetical protein